MSFTEKQRQRFKKIALTLLFSKKMHFSDFILSLFEKCLIINYKHFEVYKTFLLQ
jgi:hypothetical protein